ncbi:MAG: YbaB/EbfC family nucleoid-associated protein [Actinocatenispora sp.]
MSTDIENLLAEVRQQQEEVERIQKSVTNMQVTGYSRHNEVTATLRGDGRFTDISIDSDAVRKMDAASLGEVVMEAVNDGLRRLAEASTAKFKPIIDAAGTELRADS